MINYLVSIGLMITVILVLEQKRKVQPDFTVFGLKIPALKMLMYAGIVIFATLIVVGYINQ